MSKRLPDANDWQARNIDDWNTKTFHAYMQDKHREMFGGEYVTFRGWRVEQGMVGRLIGTRANEGTHDKPTITRCIDWAFAEDTPTTKYPGTHVRQNYSYMRKILQGAESAATVLEPVKE